MEKEPTTEAKDDGIRIYEVNTRKFLKWAIPCTILALGALFYRSVKQPHAHPESLIAPPQIEHADQGSTIIKLLFSGEITYSSSTEFSFELTDSNGLVVATVHADKAAGTVTINPSTSYEANGSVLIFNIANNPDFRNSKKVLFDPESGPAAFSLNKDEDEDEDEGSIGKKNDGEVWVSPVIMKRNSASLTSAPTF